MFRHGNTFKQSFRNTTTAAAILVGLATLGLSALKTGAQTTNNSLSAFPIEVDGAYTTPDEWSDITPVWFISDPIAGATPTSTGDPAANSLLFAGLARDTPTSDPELYLLYDYLPRTDAPTQPGEFLGSVSFPITLTGPRGPVSTPITVEFIASANPSGPDFFVVQIDTHDGQGFVAHPELNIEGAAGLGLTPASIVGGASPFATTTHEIFELSVPLAIPAGFGSTNGPFSPNGTGTNGYSPDPAFWGSSISGNSNDPPASSGVFTIHPDGSTAIAPHAVPVAAPQLKITLAQPNVTVTWPFNADGFVLQSTTDLGTGAIWSFVSPTPDIVGEQFSATQTISDPRHFFRLISSH
jgi:hypothetical protein